MVQQRNVVELYSPGEIVPMDGVYEIVDEDGIASDYNFVTLAKGEPFPEIQGILTDESYYQFYSQDLGIVESVG